MIFALFKILEKHIFQEVKYKARNWHGYLAGSMSGFASTVAHSGGPPVAIYLLLQEDMQPIVFNGSIVLFFAILNWVKVPYYFYAGIFDFERLAQLLWVLLLIPLGVWVGKISAQRINWRVFERLVLILLIITAVLLITS